MRFWVDLNKARVRVSKGTKKQENGEEDGTRE